MTGIVERVSAQATEKSMELEFPEAMLLKCNAGVAVFLSSRRLVGEPSRAPTRNASEIIFRSDDTDLAGDEIGLQQNGCKLCPTINNGVDSMALILRLIYREYCRACLQHLKYL
jgi:hypothetical protein